MKKTLLALIAIGLLATTPVLAQTMMDSGSMGPGMMEENQQQQQQKAPVPDQDYLRKMQTRMMNNIYSGMMDGNYNMMGNNYGMMPRGGGYFGIPPCSGGDGYNRMGHHDWTPMMGGYGMMAGPGYMGGPGMMWNPKKDNLEKYQAFANETRELRRKLHNLMFDYGEARWNPDTTMGELNKMAEEIDKLRQEIQKKLPQ